VATAYKLPFPVWQWGQQDCGLTTTLRVTQATELGEGTVVEPVSSLSCGYPVLA
jgi:hypothetical protein